MMTVADRRSPLAGEGAGRHRRKAVEDVQLPEHEMKR